MELLNYLATSGVHFFGIDSLALVDLHAAGLSELWTKILKNWITPLYIAAVAVFAIIFLKDRAWMKLIGFVGIAAVVGVLVFAGSEIFGGKNAGLTKVAKNAAKDINAVDGTALTGLNDSFVNSSSSFTK